MAGNKSLPEYFYRYYRFKGPEIDKDEIEPIFMDSALYFIPPSKFNDPFDCRSPILYNGSKKRWNYWLTEQIEKRYPNYSANEKKEIFNKMVSNKKTMTPEYISEKLELVFKDRIGVLCLSEVSDSILMWAHYTSGYKGFCLEFNNPTRIQLFQKALTVRYRKKYPLCNYFTTSNLDKMRAALLTKSNLWKYEKEWRIIEHESGPGWYHFPKELLTGIIFGSEIEKDNSDLIINWANKYGFNPDYYIVKPDREKYQLVIERLDA
ncbi:MAG: DUF2971 domain-containing protein [Candidatus Neomarinimicrobiota bacterium]